MNWAIKDAAAFPGKSPASPLNLTLNLWENQDGSSDIRQVIDRPVRDKPSLKRPLYI